MTAKEIISSKEMYDELDAHFLKIHYKAAYEEIRSLTDPGDVFDATTAEYDRGKREMRHLVLSILSVRM